MTLIFYDTETTGISTEFDQILRFAAIKTDDDLREMDRCEVHCRLSPHIIPSPEALMVNGITPAMLRDPALPTHYDATRQIRGILTEWSPALFMGFNSIRFDEELLRNEKPRSLRQADFEPFVVFSADKARHRVAGVELGDDGMEWSASHFFA